MLEVENAGPKGWYTDIETVYFENGVIFQEGPGKLHAMLTFRRRLVM